MKWRLVNKKNQIPDVRDQVYECRKEAANTRENLSHQNREEECVKARREILREKKKKRAPVGI